MAQTQPEPIALPIAAAWMYMSDDQQYNTIPPSWSDINFADVDVLFVGPAGVQSDGTFGLYNSPETGDLANRFKWIIATARGQNPNINIIVSQWWGDGDGIWGSALDTLSTQEEIDTYTQSAVAFVESYLGMNGGIDGYDIDYEDNNVVEAVSTITSQIKEGLKNLSRANDGRPFYVTVSPASTAFLGSAVPSLDYVNMQTYAGGMYLDTEDFTSLGLATDQLLYGICPETNCGTRTVAQVEAEYTENNLAGIHLWRLNSDNYVYEGQVQAEIYSFLHP